MPDDALPFAPAALGEVVFEGRWARRLGDGIGHGFRADEGAAQVRVDDGAGEVEHGLVAVPHFRIQPAREGVGVAAGFCAPFGDVASAPQLCLHGAHGFLGGGEAPLPRDRLGGTVGQHLIDTGQSARHGVTLARIIHECA